MNLSCGSLAIRSALSRVDFHRHPARQKPIIREQTRLARLDFAHRYRHWTIEQWRNILWSDKTWVTGENHRKIWATRRPGEEYDPTCIVEFI